MYSDFVGLRVIVAGREDILSHAASICSRLDPDTTFLFYKSLFVAIVKMILVIVVAYRFLSPPMPRPSGAV